MGKVSERHDIELQAVNAVYLRVQCEESIARELHSFFSLEIPGAKYSPQAKRGHWDGKIKLFNWQTRLIYFGLYQEIQTFAKNRGYSCVLNGDAFKHHMFTYNDGLEFFKSLNIPPQFEVRDFQIEALCHAVSSRRQLFLSPTGSGKSMIIYLLFKYFKKKTLLIVPTSNLLLQMQGDFADYGYDQPVGQWGDSVKNDDAEIVVATWQSAFKEDRFWFEQFGMVICDECHLAKSKSIKGIMERTPHCDLKFGLTGTLDGSKTHKYVLEGLFGPVVRLAKTVDLIEQKVLSPLTIKSIKLNHPEWARKYVKTNLSKYPEEIEYLISLRKRNTFLANLALSREGNTLLLFHRVEDHGQRLYDLIKEKAPDRQVFYIHGGVKAEDRDHMRWVAEKSTNTIIVASYGTLSTGVNIKRLDNLIFGSPWKSQIINLQSIGRVLRPLPGKKAVLFDIGDDLSWKAHRNHTLNHMVERLKIYAEQEFDYRLYDVDISYGYQEVIT